MKNIVLSISFLAYSKYCFSQRYRSERIYDIVGLPDGDKVSDCLTDGLPFFLIGLVIVLICMAKIKQAEKGKREAKGGKLGCLGLILMGIGFIIMLPLWAWVEASIMTLVSIAIILAIIFFGTIHFGLAPLKSSKLHCS